MLVTEQGYTPAKATKELGVAEMTMRTWLKARGWRGSQQSLAPDQSDDPKVLRAHIRDLARKLRQAEMEKEILKSDGLLCQPKMRRFILVQEHRRIWPVRAICRVLAVTPAGYYALQVRPVSRRKRKQMELTE